MNGYVNGLLAGRLWMNTQGQIEILNHRTSELCQVKYLPPPSFFSKEPENRVQGLVRDENGLIRFVIEGTSNGKCEFYSVDNPENVEVDDIKNLNLSQPKPIWQRAASTE